MEKRIELERRARKANQITDLNLDNCRSPNIVGLTDEYTALESLSLNNVGLTTLKGFPKLPNLKKLELSDNRISNGLNYLTTSPNLHYLNLSGNKISDLETLKPLKEFKGLSILDLFNNEATQVENYREKVFSMLPSLQFLDGFDCNDVEAPSEGEDEGEEDKQNSFCLNGIEIDLDELDEFEKRLKAKKKDAQMASGEGVNSAPSVDPDELDDLDEYLKDLKLREESENASKATATSATQNEIALSVNNLVANNLDSRPESSIQSDRKPTPFVILLFWFLAILNLASAATYSDDYNEDDVEEEGTEDDEDNSSLAEIYNDDLEEEEASSDWEANDVEAADDGEEDDSDDDDIDGESETEAADANESGKVDEKDTEDAAEEPQARGKKRKHDG